MFSYRFMLRKVVLCVVIIAFPCSVFAERDANNVPDVNNTPKADTGGSVPDVNTIVNKANIVAYYQGEDGRADVKMTITNKEGQKRNREFTMLRKDMKDGGDQKYFVYFHRPADVRKMVYMVHKHAELEEDDDRWLYLPALDLVKRIAASDKRTSFVGSDYLYEDVSGRSLEADTHELVRTTDKYYVVKNVPKKPDMVKFAYYNTYINRETFLPEKIEYYNEKGNVYREIEALEVEKIQGFPTPVKSIVRNLETEGTTLMEYSDVKYNIGVDEDIFSERYLRRPPRIVLR